MEELGRIKPSTAQMILFVLAEKLDTILNEADKYDHGRPGEADKKRQLQKPHCKYRQLHIQIVACFHFVYRISTV